MTTVTQDLHAASVDALVEQLPTAQALHAERISDGAAAPETAAVVAAFVGATSADFAIALLDAEALAPAGGDAPQVSLVDVLRPALEAATGPLGSGVLGEGRLEERSSLFSDADAVRFRLLEADGRLAGEVAVRIRQNGTVSADRDVDRSVVGKLGRISNVEMALAVEIGRTRMSVRDLLALEPGAVVELDRSAGSPADILLNGRLIAHGEVVVVDQEYAVRITQILDVADGIA
ncbi:flagellar motor switch protein FliN [Microbacterium sp. STN6]|uniref:flagellar motor switch protein FliN n=1 Tax=Microbacterium sp. STN6 TaxID=2995588 RepID=UPI0022608E0D|nr:flagellar motor switch protein FliN [Microbacterium sp. STN6]MCX7522392.1 flagellar motor switch protein FliN [Microbacterium sp. STN6]